MNYFLYLSLKIANFFAFTILIKVTHDKSNGGEREIRTLERI
jgi:hypothetical protein